MERTEIKLKTIKDLEFMAKKLRKRINYIDAIMDSYVDAPSMSESSKAMAILVSEYKSVKREIVEISNMI